jgi:type II secretory pathway predicted ATPase ExeA
MYGSYWGLAESPFRGGFDARLFYQGIAQEEALARLHFLVDEHRVLGLLFGTAGSGKSMLLEMFARQLPAFVCQRALVNVAGIELEQFLWLISSQLGVEVSRTANRFTLARALEDHLAANRYQQLSTVLLLDDADEASPAVLTEIVRLTQLDMVRDARLTIVLAGQAARAGRLGMRLLNLAELRVDLDGWDADETAAYIKSALSVAGRSTPVFSETALARLHENSGGIPRRVKQLADFCLLAGAAQNAAQIDAATVESASEELGIAAPHAEAYPR